jgi:hypothetical protein
VLSIHGSEERLGAQAPPDWQENAIFYDSSAINALFSGDATYLKWRNQYGPTHLVLNACQVNIGFERVLISTITRPGGTGGQTSQSAQGLGKGCKPLTETQELTYDNPRLGFKDSKIKTRAQWDKIPAGDRTGLEDQLKQLNKEWGYFGQPPVPDKEVLRYYFDVVPRGGWPKVEVGVGAGHNVHGTGIPFWNRATGPKSGESIDCAAEGSGKCPSISQPARPSSNTTAHRSERSFGGLRRDPEKVSGDGSGDALGVVAELGRQVPVEPEGCEAVHE